MRTLKRLGFYREMGYVHGVSIATAPRAAKSDPRAIAYLKKGVLFIASPGPVRDIVDDARGFVGTASVLTDGVWAWRSDLVYYVETYGLELAEDFIEHLHRVQFRVPELSRDELRALGL